MWKIFLWRASCLRRSGGTGNNYKCKSRMLSKIRSKNWISGMFTWNLEQNQGGTIQAGVRVSSFACSLMTIHLCSFFYFCVLFLLIPWRSLEYRWFVGNASWNEEEELLKVWNPNNSTWQRNYWKGIRLYGQCSYQFSCIQVRTADILPVDLNSFLCKNAKILADFFTRFLQWYYSQLVLVKMITMKSFLFKNAKILADFFDRFWWRWIL